MVAVADPSAHLDFFISPDDARRALEAMGISLPAQAEETEATTEMLLAMDTLFAHGYGMSAILAFVNTPHRLLSGRRPVELVGTVDGVRRLHRLVDQEIAIN